MPAQTVSSPRQPLVPQLAGGCLSLVAVVGAFIVLATVGAGPSSASESSQARPSTAQLWRSPVGSPQSPPVLAGFDPPEQRWLAGHRGVDLSATTGSLVRAAGTGEVTFAAPIADRGVVVVSHGTVRTTYEPVDARVTVGTEIAVGEILGTVGEGGHCNARCLHWGLRRGEQYLNPLLLLNQQPPVLKAPTTRFTNPTLRSGSTPHESERSEPRAARKTEAPAAPRSTNPQLAPDPGRDNSEVVAVGSGQPIGYGLLAAAAVIGTGAGIRVRRR